MAQIVGAGLLAGPSRYRETHSKIMRKVCPWEARDGERKNKRMNRSTRSLLVGMLGAVFRRSAARRARPALAGSSAQPIEVRSWFEPAWFGLGRDRGGDCLNLGEFHRVSDHDPQKSGEPDVVGKGSERVRTASLG